MSRIRYTAASSAVGKRRGETMREPEEVAAMRVLRAPRGKKPPPAKNPARGREVPCMSSAKPTGNSVRVLTGPRRRCWRRCTLPAVMRFRNPPVRTRRNSSAGVIRGRRGQSRGRRAGGLLGGRILQRLGAKTAREHVITGGAQQKRQSETQQCTAVVSMNQSSGGVSFLSLRARSQQLCRTGPIS